MEQKELTIEGRDGLGSTSSGRLRKDGMLPGVLYGGGAEAIPVVLNTHDFHMTVRGCAPAQIFKCKSKDAGLNGRMVIVKEIQKEPLKDLLLHVDFLAIEEGQGVEISVPLEIIGVSPAVKEGRAMLNQTVYELRVECPPSLIPSKLTVDISGLEESQSIHAGDVVLPSGITLKSNPSQSLISAIGNRRAAKTAAGQGGEGGAGAGGESAAATPKAS
ncbi:MAG: 50S ribosomal protein L25 [Bdellovibrionales bacterium]|nr:50S ribosomal protein L25 [Bdellovibrionales bacterium]